MPALTLHASIAKQADDEQLARGARIYFPLVACCTQAFLSLRA